jgi:hypothetical protein
VTSAEIDVDVYEILLDKREVDQEKYAAKPNLRVGIELNCEKSR